MENVAIRYCFILPDGSEEVFNLQLDAQTLDLVGNILEPLPAWTILRFHQCPNCPFTADTHPHCPLAVNLVNVVNHFDRLLSYKEIHVDVMTGERSVSQDTTVQEGVSSLMGLVIATSGCPHTAFFKPMARFHLPFSSEEETMYRATSMYLLAQYFLKKYGAANKCVGGISKEALDCLISYPWPGNVRELENTIERAVILAKKPLIEKENLFLSPPDITSLGKPGFSFGSKSLRKVEKSLIANVLEETKWNLSKAAQILEISRTTLYSKIKKHKLAK